MRLLLFTALFGVLTPLLGFIPNNCPALLMLFPNSATITAQDIYNKDKAESLVHNNLPIWELTSDADDIRVYRRPSLTSSIDEVRIEATFKTTLPLFLDLISDVSRYPEWVYKCSEASTISRSLDSDLVYYARTDFPWPLQDRDLIVYSTRTTDPVSGIVTSTSTARPSLLPQKEGVVRLSTFVSVWNIIPVSDSVIRVDYHVAIDPGGKLPDWVINLGITAGPRKTMERLRELKDELVVCQH
ncbi:MAG: ribosome-associated toxin RatA of RatAB toxin-antitoxin module [Neolewinella sp.]|jgi:hypothetical protein